MVSNVDQIMLVASVFGPKLRPAFLDRVLAAAEYSNLKTFIVINKMDLDKKKFRTPEIAEIYRSIGYPVLLVSAAKQQGVDEIKERLRDKTTVITGHSGVGKTSLLNLIEPDLELPVGEVSRKTKRGTHTTTWAELFPLSFGGWIADTPGMRSFALWNIPSDDLDYYFVEMRPLVGDCRFGAGCNHENEPGCAILKAVEEGRISALRYEGFRKLHDTISEEEDDKW
jgi:ribosome biogenesis GTPase